jgi:hypothetical protein
MVLGAIPPERRERSSSLGLGAVPTDELEAGDPV